MARGVNKVLLIGHLGADPETRYTASGSAITTIRLATTEAWRDKQSGETKERTEWHRVKFFGKLAEIAGEYLKKGRQVYVEGSIRTEKFTGSDGQEKFLTEIVANEMQLLGGEGDGNRERPQQAKGGRAPAPAAPAATAGDSFQDDDIPF